MAILNPLNRSPEATGTTKATGPTHALLERLNNDNLGHSNLDASATLTGDARTLAVYTTTTYLLNNQLCNPIPDLDLEIDVRQVGENNTHRPAVVGVDDSRHGVDAMLGSEPGARRYTAVCVCVSDTILTLILEEEEEEQEGESIHVPTGTEMLISVATMARPRAGMVVSFALYRSWPAAKALPLVGGVAVALRSLTCSEFSAAVAADAAGAECVGAAMLASGVGVARPESVPRGSVDGCVRGVGSITFVRLGSGLEGSDGGSWSGAGVLVEVGSAVDILRRCEEGCGAEGRVVGRKTRRVFD
jgi:hypothetical protein